VTFTVDELKRLAAERWYYKAELAEGVFTNGTPRMNVAVVREFLRQIDVSGTSCLDIGSQEFLAPIVLLRQGAKSVTAYDRINLAQQYKVMKQVYGVDFDYLNGFPLGRLKRALSEAASRRVFDVVVFSGVLYHMIDPLAGLAMARSFLRSGGLMVIETSVKFSGDHVMQFNAGGKIYSGSNYFQVSVATLDYWIRMLHMAPIDCAVLAGGDGCRCVVICRAVDAVEADRDDLWIRRRFISSDFEPEGLNYGELVSVEGPIPYRPMEAESIIRTGTNSIDLWETVSKRERYRANRDLSILRLADEF
jgi:SAM-dependent methyltransferase